MQVLIATDSFGCDFWVNFLLTVLAWLPGVFHAWWVVATKDDQARVALQHFQAETAPYRVPQPYERLPYERLPATMPPSASKGYYEQQYPSAPPLPPPV
jgi:Proteolipid membrane potential modulator